MLSKFKLLEQTSQRETNLESIWNFFHMHSTWILWVIDNDEVALFFQAKWTYLSGHNYCKTYALIPMAKHVELMQILCRSLKWNEWHCSHRLAIIQFLYLWPKTRLLLDTLWDVWYLVNKECLTKKRSEHLGACLDKIRSFLSVMNDWLDDWFYLLIDTYICIQSCVRCTSCWYLWQAMV